MRPLNSGVPFSFGPGTPCHGCSSGSVAPPPTAHGSTSRASAPEATGAKCSLPASRWSTVQISGAAASSGRRAMYSP